jgi:hypothetical protein
MDVENVRVKKKVCMYVCMWVEQLGVVLALLLLLPLSSSPAGGGLVGLIFVGLRALQASVDIRQSEASKLFLLQRVTI